MAPLTKPSSSALPRSFSVSNRVFPSRCAMTSILIRRWDFAQLANSTTVRSRRHCRTPIAIAMTPGMIVIGPHRYRKSGTSYRRTTKNRPKNRAKPPIAKYAIGSRSSRLDVLEDTLRPTTPRVLQSGVVRIRNVRRTPSAGLRRDRGFWNDGGARGFQRLADGQHAGPGDSDKAEGDHRERDRPERLRQGAAEHRSHDEPRAEDERGK